MEEYCNTIYISNECWIQISGCVITRFIPCSTLLYDRYVESDTYSQAQGVFEAAKAIHSPDAVADILMHLPYHVESLLTLADYFKFSGEHQMAANCIGKCLYALERAWHPLFSPLQGNCQLGGSHVTNEVMFLTLSSHMKDLDVGVIELF